MSPSMVASSTDPPTSVGDLCVRYGHWSPRFMCCFPGLSLDHQTVSAVSRVRLSEREEESMSCFLRACDAALSYMQELDKVNL